jgi:hypothetical protein
MIEAEFRSDLEGRIKELFVPEFSQMINSANGVTVTSPDYSHSYRYFIGRGNNSMLINRLLGSRGNWIRTDSPSNAHFVWTQCKDMEFIRSLITLDI